MNGTEELFYRLLAAIGRLALNPFYYIGILFVVIQYRRHIILERKFFASRLHSLGQETWRTVAWGLLAGTLASLLLAVTGVKLEAGTVVLLWGLTLGLLFVRVRYLCLAYSAGLLGLLHMTAPHLPGWGENSGFAWFYQAVDQVDLPSLFVLVAVLHLLEAGLILFQGDRLATPLFVESKRGKIVGSYQLQGFWPVPLFLLTPVASGGVTLPWEPFLAGNWQAVQWDFLVFPAIIGFTGMTLSRLPKPKLRQTAGLLLGYGAVLLAGAVVSAFWTPFGWAAAIVCILLHEAIITYGDWAERQRSPLYVNGPKGLTILAVLPGSSAQGAGLTVGEVVHKVNGVQVRTKEELHEALRLNSAFCKLEVLNLAGESKFISRPLYEDEHHQLGIIVAPDDDAPYYIEEKTFSFPSYVRRKWMGVLRNERQQGM
ncbi:PDZ domain-containing protein [Gorillibacterium timonense]|uniref:PDZ domain-containing protein n=1 Tax=Gorillibacterium timonense TaxID=1689269 RepID=UPI00071C9C80|nr:PDZ domain-containing protein [Gorillibacterium timonense]